ncbi:hypothetical protein [Foetidibacter luteolus]|uniref:hypothetical protein n=1 Tax=Foetidibacter luteolus TaxID=2608880 RepID=UPI00129BD906|nr:hypothetical protein [Foetidibacter luteolus]
MKIRFILVVLLIFTINILNAQDSIQPPSGALIITDTQYYSGVYLNFEEFKNNQPSIPYVIAKVDEKDSVSFIIYKQLSDSTFEKIESAWGICIRNEIYVLDKGLLIPIEKKDTSFFASATIDPEVRKNQAVFWRRSMKNINSKDCNPFSKMASSNNESESNTTIQRKGEAEAKLDYGKLDMFSGKLNF